MRERADRLAPPEETARRGGNGGPSSGGAYNDGTIYVSSTSISLPKNFEEDDDKKESRILGLEPVVFAVLVVALLFIGFVAWQISLMPPK